MNERDKMDTIERLKQEKIEEEGRRQRAQLDLENVLKQLQYYQSISKDQMTNDDRDQKVFYEREEIRLNGVITQCDISIQAKQSNIERLSK